MEKRFSKTVKKDQVYKKPDSFHPIVAKQDRVFDFEVEIIADSPHENGDLSYPCGSDYCRCMQ